MKKNFKPINLTDKGPIFDLDGHMPTEENFAHVLLELFSKKVLPKTRRKITVLVSGIKYHKLRAGQWDREPFRYEEEKTYTFGFLCRKWRDDSGGKDFDPEEFKRESEIHFKILEKQGDKKSAWTPYVFHKQYENAIKAENKYQQELKNAREPETIKKIIKKRESEYSSSQLYVGG
ncbi:MAG: hypothetical protein NT068_03460 [Candidatus Nomurabacteria bacterium]|nr:hypothetical protein [Candidatus Nomurabacteria bacterium]